MPGIKRKAPDTPRSKSKQPANKRQKTSSSSKERGNPKTKANNKAKGKGNTKGAAPKSSPNFKHFVPPKQREEVQKKTRPFRAPREDRDGSDNDEDVLVEDTEFFAQNRQYLSFLQSADLENGAPYTKQEKKKMKRKEKEQLAKKAEEKKKKSADDDDDNGDLEASYMRQFAKEKASRSKKSKEEEEDDEEEQQDGEDDEDNEYGSDGEIDDYEDDDEDDDADDDDVDDDEELEVNDEINKKLSKSRLPTFESTTGNVSTDAKYLASTVRDVETVPLSMQIEITKFKRAEKERQLAWLKEKKAQEKEQMVDKKALESKMEKQKIEKLLARLPLVLQSPLDDEHIESAAHYEMQLDLWKQEIARISLEIVSNPEQTIRADIIVESANRAGEDDGDDGSEEEEDFFDKKNRKKEAKGKAHAKGKGKGKGKKRGKDSSQPPMKRPDLMFDANREAAKFLGLVEGHRTDESVRLHWGVFALLKLAEAPEARKPGYKLSHVVSNLAMLSLLQLFKDILPGYKLQPSLLGLPDDPWTKQVSNESTEDEKDLTLAEIQHKKETQKRIDYEHSFLLAFRRYLQQLRFSLLQSKKLHARQERRGIDPNELTFKTKMALVTKQEEISIKCLAELAAVSTTMTWGDRVLGLLIPCMGHPNEELSKRCCQSLKEILIADIHGDSTVDAVNLIAHFIRQRKFNLHPRVLDTLLFVKVTEDIKELLKSFKGDESLQMSYRGKKIKIKAEGMSDVFKLKNRERRNMSSHQAKRTREMRTIEKDVQEANAERNNQRVKQMQAQSLHNLFAIYFRILKQCPHSTLTPAVLRGLCRYSHLISLDFQADVLRLLQTLCTSDYAVSYPSPSAAQATSHEDPTGSKKQVKDLSDADYKISTTGHTRNGILFRLQCAITAFEIQKSNANAIETDMKTFYSQAFQDLLIVPVEEWRCWGFDSSQHASSSSVFNTTVRATKKMSITDLSKVNAERLTVELDDIIGAAIEVYKAMILDLRSVPDSRVCAFSKRALELATHTTETGGTLGLLSSMTQTLSRNTSAQAMIDSVPNELTEASSYLPFVAVPDWSHAVSSQMWELPALLRFHYHPAVRTFSNSILRGNYSTPHPPFDLLLRYDTRGGGFNPAVPEPKPHPMVKRMKDDPEAILCPTPNPNFSPFLKEIAARARDVTKSSTPQEAFETYYQTQKTLSYRALLDEVDGRSKAIHKLQEQFQASHPTPAPKTVSKTVSSKRK